MEPKKKLEFLEKFAFKDINIVEIKNRCKLLITDRNNDLNKTISQMEIVENTVKELNKPEEKKFPFKIKKSDYELFQKNEKIKSKNADIMIKKLRAKSEILQVELNDIRVLKTYINSKNENIENLINKLEKLSFEEKLISFNGDSVLEKHEQSLKIKLSSKKLIILKDKLKEYIAKHEEIISNSKTKSENDIMKIDENLWKEYTKDEAEETIKDTKACLKDAQKVSFLKKILIELLKIQVFRLFLYL